MSKLRLLQVVFFLLMIVGLFLWVNPETSPYGLTLFSVSLLGMFLARLGRFIFYD